MLPRVLGASIAEPISALGQPPRWAILRICQMDIFRGWGVDELLASHSEKQGSQEEKGNFLFCCCLSVGVGYVRAWMGPGRWQLPAPSFHLHFPNLFAIVAQDLEESIQDLRQIIEQVNVRHRLQNQDLTQGKKPGGKVTAPQSSGTGQ